MLRRERDGQDLRATLLQLIDFSGWCRSWNCQSLTGLPRETALPGGEPRYASKWWACIGGSGAPLLSEMWPKACPGFWLIMWLLLLLCGFCRGDYQRGLWHGKGAIPSFHTEYSHFPWGPFRLMLWVFVSPLRWSLSVDFIFLPKICTHLGIGWTSLWTPSWGSDYFSLGPMPWVPGQSAHSYQWLS